MGGWEAGMGPRASQEEDRGSRGGKAEPVIKGGAGGMWGVLVEGRQSLGSEEGPAEGLGCGQFSWREGKACDQRRGWGYVGGFSWREGRTCDQRRGRGDVGGSRGGKAKPVIRGGAEGMLGSRGGKAERVIRGGVGGHWRRNVPERAFARERG